MKALKFSMLMCIGLAFICLNANAQKPLVEYTDAMSYTMPALSPCLTEDVSGMVYMSGFATDSPSSDNVYHEKGGGILTGATTGIYEMEWIGSCKTKTYDDGSPENQTWYAITHLWHNGKLIMVNKWQFYCIWTGPGGIGFMPVFEVWDRKCK